MRMSVIGRPSTRRTMGVAFVENPGDSILVTEVCLSAVLPLRDYKGYFPTKGALE